MTPTSLRTHLLTLMAGTFAPVLALAAPEPMAVSADSASSPQTVVVTARLRQEDAQSVPISLSVVTAAALTATRTDNISS